jgi:hypothetical protein
LNIHIYIEEDDLSFLHLLFPACFIGSMEDGNVENRVLTWPLKPYNFYSEYGINKERERGASEWERFTVYTTIKKDRST